MRIMCGWLVCFFGGVIFGQGVGRQLLQDGARGAFERGPIALDTFADKVFRAKRVALCVLAFGPLLDGLDLREQCVFEGLLLFGRALLIGGVIGRAA